MKSKTAYYRILGLIRDRMQYALVAGRYPPPYTIEAYLNRDKSKAFRCIAYQGAIRDVSALQVAAAALKNDIDKEAK